MRTITVTRNEHGLIQLAFDADTARMHGLAAITMDRSVAGDMAHSILHGTPTTVSFIGIVHDGGEVIISAQSTSDV